MYIYVLKHMVDQDIWSNMYVLQELPKGAVAAPLRTKTVVAPLKF